MVSRLMLNLRKEVLRRGPVMHPSSHGGRGYGNGRTGYEESYQLTAAHEISAAKTFESSIIGNLGAPIITFERTGYEDEYGLFDEDDERSDQHGHQMSDMRHSDGDEEGRGDLAKKPSLTTTLSGGPLPKVFGGKRRPRTPGDPPEHTRSLPGQLVVQMTEEVVVVTEAADPTHTPLPPPPRSSRFQRSPPASPHSPLTPTTPRTPQSAPSPHTPRTAESAHSQSLSLSAPHSAYPSRPPHSAGAVYPPASPHAPESPLTHGYDSRPLKPSRSAQATSTARRSWAAPPSWKLSLDRERERKGTS
ncbi:hypothetical protein TRAPUB_11068 [Trametes pubescens]|uniref:Uncharacterized protein n=1 Tax=Trametes pubescens TaxID=154538 RepID=A0A1M2VXV0_TRAPU|nr:hypothetical protein TRAPUB_11068 [Trametes pubescens]